MSVIININGPVNSLVVNTSGQGTSIMANGDEVWSSGPGYPPYLTFSSASSFTLDNLAVAAGGPVPWDGTLEYSTDTDTWSTWDGTTISSAADNGTHKLYLRGSGNTKITGMANSGFALSGSSIFCSGDMRALLDYSNTESVSPAQSCFFDLFNGCTALVEGPDILLTSLPIAALGQMFKGCTALKKASVITATSIGQNSLRSLYYGCTSLNSMSALHVTQFNGANSCNGMYTGCSLIKISETQTGEYQTPYRIPTEGTATAEATTFTNMFANTGGTFTGTPAANTTYYTSNRVIG